MKNKLLICVAFIIILLGVAFGTYCWYLYFHKSLGYNPEVNSYSASDSLTFTEQSVVYINDAKDVSDDDIASVTPYIFTVSNDTSKQVKYTIEIEDLKIDSITDGCSSDTLLSREQLNYELKMNDKVVSTGSLNELKDNLLDVNNINGNKKNVYELRIYIHSKATKWLGKHFHYRVILSDI